MRIQNSKRKKEDWRRKSTVELELGYGRGKFEDPGGGRKIEEGRRKSKMEGEKWNLRRRKSDEEGRRKMREEEKMEVFIPQG